MRLLFHAHVVTHDVVTIDIDGIALDGELYIPDNPHAIVIIANEGHSSRQSIRNYYLAQRLHQQGYATLLVDLLNQGEDVSLRRDTPLLGERLHGVTIWVNYTSEAAGLPIAYFASNLGAAAALIAARDDRSVTAVVLCNGRIDFAYNVLTYIKAPTMLITAADNTVIRKSNEAALGELPGPKVVVNIPHTRHLFEEQGALEKIASLALDWFNTHAHKASG